MWSTRTQGSTVIALSGGFDDVTVRTVTGVDLWPVRFVDADFEDGAGRPAMLDADLLGESKQAGQTDPAGAVISLKAGSGRTRIW